MSLPVFIDLAESEQISEIRRFLKSKGADITEEPTGHGLVAELSDIIRALKVCWKDGVPDAEVEMALNSTIALLFYVPPDQAEPLIKSLCESMASTKCTPARIRVLSNLFYGLDERSPNRYYVYCTLLRMASQADLLQLVEPKIDDVNAWIRQWSLTVEQHQTLLRILHQAYTVSKQTENATKVLIDLLSTYTEENASQAREDAQRCIVTCLADPMYFLMDHLLTLKPVKFLEGELIHDLLTIFVSGKLSDYVKFYQSNKDFIDSIGLNNESNLQKMRLLTFMQMAEGRSEISFDTIQREMDITEDEVESFIIDVVRTKAVRAKMDQMARCVKISSTTHRTFSKQQWAQLRSELQRWQNNLNSVMASIQTITSH